MHVHRHRQTILIGIPNTDTAHTCHGTDTTDTLKTCTYVCMHLHRHRQKHTKTHRHTNTDTAHTHATGQTHRHTQTCTYHCGAWQNVRLRHFSAHGRMSLKPMELRVGINDISCHCAGKCVNDISAMRTDDMCACIYTDTDKHTKLIGIPNTDTAHTCTDRHTGHTQNLRICVHAFYPDTDKTHKTHRHTKHGPQHTHARTDTQTHSNLQ